MAKRARGETRKRLLEHAVKIVQTQGFDALTTSALTRAAGVSQPAFYAHFSHIAELTEHLINELGNKFIAFTVDAQTHLRELGAADYPALVTHFGAILSRMNRDPALIDLYLRERNLGGELAACFRAIEAQVIQEIEAHLRQNMTSWGITHPGCERAIRESAPTIYEALLSGYRLQRHTLPLSRTAELLATQVLAISMVCFAEIEQVTSLLPLTWKENP